MLYIIELKFVSNSKSRGIPQDDSETCTPRRGPVVLYFTSIDLEYRSECSMTHLWVTPVRFIDSERSHGSYCLG